MIALNSPFFFVELSGGDPFIEKWAFVPNRFVANRPLIICGIAATLAELAFSIGSTVPNLGASGAIAGVLGFYILMLPQKQARVLIGRVVASASALIVIGFRIVLRFFSGFTAIANAADTGGVAYLAHIAGFVLTFIFRGNTRAQLTG